MNRRKFIIFSIIVSIIFATVPLILGVVVLKIVHNTGWESQRSSRIALIVLGLIAPFVWAGFYIGPVFVAIAGLVPMLKG